MDGALIQVYAVDKGMKLAGVKTKGPENAMYIA